MQEYKNHYQMKKNRIIKLQQTKAKCEICGEKAFEIHHRDETKENHSVKNLIVLCKKCHSIVHSGRKNKTSKFVRLYGMTLDQMAEKCGGCSTRYWMLHKQGKLLKILQEKE